MELVEEGKKTSLIQAVTMPLVASILKAGFHCVYTTDVMLRVASIQSIFSPVLLKKSGASSKTERRCSGQPNLPIYSGLSTDFLTV